MTRRDTTHIPADVFACAVTIDGPLCVIEPIGDIDLCARPQLSGVVSCIRAGVREVRVNFAGVPFMDTSGLAFLHDLRERCQETGSRLSIDGLRSQPLRLCVLLDLLPPSECRPWGRPPGSPS
ncbi:STAS domain-containing protein [Streptacidiphilus sp. 4-A2]|nr:STAS domain-containing protein [Streptacidiphilus sp. 4-A2]